MTTAERYKADWYTKRINQNREASKFLVSKINLYKEQDFPWTTNDLMLLPPEDLMEIAVAAFNKKISITLGTGADFTNGADGKFSVVRSNSYGKGYSSLITCTNKDFIVAVVYENIQSKFYFFAFPCTLKQHSIPFDPITGNPVRSNYMWNYECDTFEEMAMSSMEGYSAKSKKNAVAFENLFQVN